MTVTVRDEFALTIAKAGEREQLVTGAVKEQLNSYSSPATSVFVTVKVTVLFTDDGRTMSVPPHGETEVCVPE